MAALNPCSPNYTFLNQGLSHAITHRKLGIYGKPQPTQNPRKNSSLVFLLPKTFSEEEQRKACQDLATFASLRHSLFQVKAVPESDESKLAAQAAAASVSSPSLREAQGSAYTGAS